MIKKVLYLGPSGSYSEKAKEIFASYYASDCEFIPLDSIYKIINSINTEESVAAVIPIENSVEGVVRETQDNLFLLAEKGVRVLAETKLSVEHSLKLLITLWLSVLAEEALVRLVQILL